MSGCACNTNHVNLVSESLSKLDALRQAMAPHRDLPLVVSYGTRKIAAGYHVTEVKAHRISALDCGANPENWVETSIQFWDVDADGARHMTVNTFLNILEKVAERMPLDGGSRLSFEVGRNGEPMQLFAGAALDTVGGTAQLTLMPFAATCKPMHRSLSDDETGRGKPVAKDAERAACCA